MAYDYEKERERLFTDEGQRQLLEIRDNVKRLLSCSGAFKLGNGIGQSSGDSWQQMACIDRLVELGEIVELARADGLTPVAQNRVFVAR